MKKLSRNMKIALLAVSTASKIENIHDPYRSLAALRNRGLVYSIAHDTAKREGIEPGWFLTELGKQFIATNY